MTTFIISLLGFGALLTLVSLPLLSVLGFLHNMQAKYTGAVNPRDFVPVAFHNFPVLPAMTPMYNFAKSERQIPMYNFYFGKG